MEKNVERLPNNVMRKNLYQKLWRTCDLGDTRGERIKLPNCGEVKVRQIYPQQDGKYMGLMPLRSSDSWPECIMMRILNYKFLSHCNR